MAASQQVVLVRVHVGKVGKDADRVKGLEMKMDVDVDKDRDRDREEWKNGIMDG